MVSELIREIRKLETTPALVNLENVLMIQYPLHQTLYQNIKLLLFKNRVPISGFIFSFLIALFSWFSIIFYVKTINTKTYILLRYYIVKVSTSNFVSYLKKSEFKSPFCLKISKCKLIQFGVVLWKRAEQQVSRR